MTLAGAGGLTDKPHERRTDMPDTQTAIEISHLGRVFVPVSDQDRALAFYTETLGFEKRADLPFGDGDRWIEVAPAGGVTAIALVAAGVCDAETIDTVVKSGFGARMAVLGPMEQSDLVGLDLTLDIQNVLLADLDRSTEATQFLRDKVAAGKLGMRSGEGFRRWTKEQADAVRERLRNYLAEQAKAAKK